MFRLKIKDSSINTVKIKLNSKDYVQNLTLKGCK